MLKRIKEWHNKLAAHRWIQGGILGFIIGVFGVMIFLLAQKWMEAPSVARFLPAEETVVYFELEQERFLSALQDAPTDFILDSEFFYQFLTMSGNDFPAWVGDHVGFALIKIKEDKFAPALFWEIGDTEKARQDLEKTKFNYEKHWQWNNYMVFTTDSQVQKILEAVQNGEKKSLQKDESFIKLRPGLLYKAPFFAYLKSKSFFEFVSNDYEQLSKLNISEAFSVLGVVMEDHPAGLRLQVNALGDKTVLGGQPLFHVDSKYKGVLRQYFADEVNLFWGGQNGQTTLDQLQAFLNAQVQPYFGMNPRFQALEASFLSSEFALVEWGTPQKEDDTAENPEGELDVVATPVVHGVLAFHLSNDQWKQWEELVADLTANGLMELNAEGDTLSFNEVRDIAYPMGDLLLHWKENFESPSSTNRELTVFGDQVIEWGPSYAQSFYDPDLLLASEKSAHRLFSSFNLFDDGIKSIHIFEF
ncbi:MAG: hypothetical protein UW70_C0067G0002 [Candidatus Peregrinibacteria bacterium GW2011_GWA2_44_7]|nr:MAG: hypothetical protein UW70_C0067G0002 [Candidatus Peregrinibacteria bacterium GW2011_GWA2_44_7]